MILALLIWNVRGWLIPGIAVAAALALAGLVAWSYGRSAGRITPKFCAALLKITAVTALVLCLLEPLFSGVRPRPGANLFMLVADNSHSLRVRDPDESATRGELLRRQIETKSDWQTRLSQDFDVRRYTFDRRLHTVEEFQNLAFDGSGSALYSSLADIGRRFHGRPHAGVLLFTDGRATDAEREAIDWESLPPLYPVVLGGEREPRDIRVERLGVTLSNFEATPATIAVEAAASGYDGSPIVLQLLDSAGQEVQRAKLVAVADKPLTHRFQFRPAQAGVSFYRVRAFAESDESRLEHPERIDEATFENNSRWAVVDRSGGPYRVLYVTGRPNWDFKFLRRAVQEDEEVTLVGLIRIAKKEPKFTFRGRTGETTNPLFRGFGNQADEEAERYDQPVLLRLGTTDAEELRDGFPKAAEDLFLYHAVILDDVEAAYFTQDQMSLLQSFVSQRGGGFLMLGGRESFAGGKYAHTPVGELLPVYTDVPTEQLAEQYQLSLTREGWLQEWVRLRSTEQAETQRLEEMPGFQTVNRIRNIKPGASVLARMTSADGQEYPSVVAQRFGQGKSGALLVGDMWRWNLRRPNAGESDLETLWRQTIRWLVSDVPGRVQVDVRAESAGQFTPVELLVRVRDEKFAPQDNARVTLQVTTPDAATLSITATPSDREAGVYQAGLSPRTPGPYRAEITVVAEDGSEIGRRACGWVIDPLVEEFRELTPDRPLLEELAERTGGDVVELHQLPEFVASLPNRKIPVTEPWIYPLWHQWSVFALAIGCLIGEWGVRRWNGMA